MEVNGLVVDLMVISSHVGVNYIRALLSFLLCLSLLRFHTRYMNLKNDSQQVP